VLVRIEEMPTSTSRSWIVVVAVAALLLPGCGDSSALDGGETGPGDGDGDPGDGDGDGDSGDGDGDGGPGDGDGDGDPGDGDGEPGDGDGDPAPGCGDGVLDPGEACDDGNNEPGDGCSAFCSLPGELIWEVLVDLDGLDEVGHAVVVDGGGSISVLVEVGGAGYQLVNFDLDGNLGWSLDALASEAPSLVLGAGSERVLGGRLGSQGLTRAWDGAGNQLWSALAPVSDSSVLGLAVDDEGFVITAGYHPGPNGLLARYDADGLEDWSQTQDLAGSLFPVAAGPGIWAVRAETGSLEHYSSVGDAVWTAALPELVVPRDLAVDAAGNLYVLGGLDDQSSFSVTKYDSEGALLWTSVHDEPGVDELAGGLALLPGEAGLVIAGSLAEDGLLVWYDDEGAQLAADVVLDLGGVERLHELAVTPYNYAVAVGQADADLWIRKFEI
jgi:cysteine-rich repeat protein